MNIALPSPAQIRASLAILRWDYRQLAQASGVALDTISRLCREEHKGTDRVLTKLAQALERQGLEFLENDGVRRTSHDVEVFSGFERFREFSEWVYMYLDKFGGDYCISVTDERDLQRAFGKVQEHRARMKQLVQTRNVKGRILACEGELKSEWAKIRIQERTPDLPRVSFYVFGDNFALISFDIENKPYVVLHKNSPFAPAFRTAFDAAWDKAEPV